MSTGLGFRVFLCLEFEGGTLFDQEVAHGIEAERVDDLVRVNYVAQAFRHLLERGRVTRASSGTSSGA